LIFAKPGESFQTFFRVKNLGHATGARVVHQIEPNLNVLSIVDCALFIPPSLKAGEEEEYSAEYVIPLDTPKNLKEITVTYNFVPLESKDAGNRVGEKIYFERCQSCHGERGSGDGPTATRLPQRPGDFSAKLANLSPKRREEIIVNGSGVMPAFGPVLTPKEIQSVLTYIDSMAR